MIRTNRTRPHYAQARTWLRFASRLRRSACPAFSPYHAKEDALGASFALRARSLVFSARLDAPEPAGLARLAARVAAGERYPELVARIVVAEAGLVTEPGAWDGPLDDALVDEVHIYLEEADRTGTHTAKHLLGKLLAADALWVAPLVRHESDAYGTGTVLRYHVAGGMANEVTVAISRAHEAAAAWLDWADDRAAWADAHAVAEESPYAYRVSYLDTAPGCTAGYGRTVCDADEPDDSDPDYESD